MRWSELRDALPGLLPVEGGFSSARRGLLNLPDGRVVFVKSGVDETTRGWARKEVAVYRFLEKHGYPYCPEVLAAGTDGFALEALQAADGWDWTGNWTTARLEETLEAMDALAAIQPAGADKGFFEQKAVDETDDGWRPLAESPDSRRVLLAKLDAVGFTGRLDFRQMAERSERVRFSSDALVHNDVRADNGAWREETNEVRLVDWNWAQLGDRGLDLTSLLVHVHNSGFDVVPGYCARLDGEASLWLAGFWLYAATKPIWPGGPDHLRDHQFEAGLTALRFAS